MWPKKVQEIEVDIPTDKLTLGDKSPPCVNPLCHFQSETAAPPLKDAVGCLCHSCSSKDPSLKGAYLLSFARLLIYLDYHHL